jgi:hypothetical protein
MLNGCKDETIYIFQFMVSELIICVILLIVVQYIAHGPHTSRKYHVNEDGQCHNLSINFVRLAHPTPTCEFHNNP